MTTPLMRASAAMAGIYGGYKMKPEDCDELRDRIIRQIKEAVDAAIRDRKK